MQQNKAMERPIQESVNVDCPIEDTFRLFTERFADWWPLTRYSITGNEAEACVIEPCAGGRVFERARSGEEYQWGEVITWDPPRHLSFTWNPGGIADGSQTVDVEFEVEANGTRVTLTHAGWQTPGVAVCASPEHCASLSAAALERFLIYAVGELVTAA